MAVRYLTQNLITATSLCCTSSEDILYTMGYLYNQRPSLPFRFTGVGAPAAPEWICVEFAAPTRITFAGIFNHNLTDLAVGGDLLELHGCTLPCQGSGSCNWAAPDWTASLAGRLVANWNDLYAFIDQTYLSFRLDIIDQANPYPIEIGEFVLGVWAELPSAYLQPGREESPRYYRTWHATPYGQVWPAALAKGHSLRIRIKNLNDPAQVDALQIFLDEVDAQAGRFILIPNHAFPFAYFVFLENEENFAAQIARGPDAEAKEWALELRCLAKGITLR